MHKINFHLSRTLLYILKDITYNFNYLDIAPNVIETDYFRAMFCVHIMTRDHLFLRARPRPPLSSWLLCRSAMARVSHTTTGCRDLATSLAIQIQIRAANEDSLSFHSVRHFNTVGRREIGTLLTSLQRL